MIVGENLPPPLKPKLDFRQKGGGAPQIRQKYNELGFGSKFQGNLRQQIIAIRGENLPPQAKTRF